MRILIENGAYALRNLGDVAMLQVACERLRELWPRAEIHVVTEDPERLARFCPGAIPELVGRGEQWQECWNLLGAAHHLAPARAHARLRLLERSVRMVRPSLAALWITRRFSRRGRDAGPLLAHLDLVGRSDVVLASGGGYLAEPFESHACRVLETLGTASRMGKLTAVFGQGLGPMESPGLRALARLVLPCLDVLCMRAAGAGLGLLAQLGIPETAATVTGDDAIEPARRAAPARLGTGIGVNLRVAPYSRFEEADLPGLRSLLLEASARHAGPLIPVPISSSAGESDCDVLQRLLGGAACSPVGGDPDPEQVFAQIARCRVVVTGSYHAGLFALAQGVSVIGLARSPYYRDKFAGLAAQFGAGCQVFDAGQPGTPRLLAKALEEAWALAPGRRPALLRAADLQIAASRAAYARLRARVAESRP